MSARGRRRRARVGAGAVALAALALLVSGGPTQARPVRMVLASRDGKYRTETVGKAYEVWHVSWMPKVRDPRRVRETERNLEALGRRLDPQALAFVRTTASHHILCVRVPKPVFIAAPSPEIRRLRGGLEAVRIISRRQGTHMGPDRVMRSVTVHEYQLKDPREGRWTLPQTLAVDDRTGLPVQASLWVARGLPGPGGFAGSSLLVPPAGRDWRPGLGIFEYYDHNAPFTIIVPPAGCR